MNLPIGLTRERIYSPRIYPILVAALVLLAVGSIWTIGFRGDLRWIKLLIGLTVVVTVASARLSTGLGVFLLASLFPAFIVIGPTNFVLVVLVFVFWVARVVVGTEARPTRTPCDVPLLLLTLAYAISWVNVPREPYAMEQAWYYSQNHIGSLMVFYMAVAAVRGERDTHILLRFLHVMAAIVYLGAVLEVTTGISITGLGAIRGARYTLGGGAVRAGGLLGSHDMLADFCSMNIPLHLYLIYTRRGHLSRLVYGLLAVLCVVTMFMTSNRGGIVAFCVGLFYLGFLLRRDLGLPVLVGSGAAGAAVFLIVDALLSRAGKTLSVFYRLAKTRFYGVLPETRVGVYEHVKARIARHFWLGEGPYYRLSGSDLPGYPFWPHNAFAYYWATVGLLGLLGFVLVIGQILRKSWQERARKLGEGSAAELLVVLHVMVVVFLVAQQRTDFQRGFVFTYYIYFLLGFTIGTWKLAVRQRRERLAAAGASAG